MDTLIKMDKYGKRRKFVKLNCTFCNNEFEKQFSLLRKNNYCTKECSYLASRNRIKCRCANCGETFLKRRSSLDNSKSGLFFCNRACKDKAQSIEGNCPEIRPNHYNNGSGSYRARAFRKLDKKCAKCGFSKNQKILQVHHKDENRNNNELENLEILCPNCHAEIHWG